MAVSLETISTFEERVRPSMRRVAVAAALTFVVSVFGAQAATATSITLGAAGDYGLFVGLKDAANISGSGTSVTGKVGIGTSGTYSFGSGTTITGEVYRDSSVTGSSSITPSGGWASNYSLSSVITAATNAAAAASALTENVSMIYTSSGSTNSTNAINATGSSTSVTIKALTNLSENVLHITSLDLSNGNLTLDANGYTDAKFVIDVSGSFTIANASNIILKNGVDASDVLFNIEGTGTTVSIAGVSGSAFYGTVLAGQRNVTVSNESIHGAVIDGFKSTSTTHYTYTQNGGADLYYTAYKPAKVPEPASLALFGGGLAVLAVARRRQVTRRRALI